METTTVDLNANANPCKEINTPRGKRVWQMEHPNAETVKKAEEITNKLFLLNASEMRPLKGLINNAVVASNPEKNPASVIEAPSETE